MSSTFDLDIPVDPAEALDLSIAIQPLLKGRDPRVQGAALADLLALWLAGHPASIRKRLLAVHMRAVRDLVPTNE